MIIEQGGDELPIPVLQRKESGQQQPAGGNQSGNDGASLETQAQGKIADDDLLLRLNLSRSTVYKGEPIRAALKLYNRVSLVDYSVQKMPSFNGFWTQQLDTETVPNRETYNGKVYEVYTLIEYLLYPQQSGKLVIDPVEMTALVQVIVQNSQNYDPFFGTGREIYNVKRELKTPRITVDVKELPAGAPAGFGGAVGKFSMEAEPAATNLTANFGCRQPGIHTGPETRTAYLVRTVSGQDDRVVQVVGQRHDRLP